MFVTHIDIATLSSPKVNPDLLQRSEVVALFNTLHRVSESLAAVEDFRKMYAKAQVDEVEAAHKRQERAVSKSLQPLPLSPPQSCSPLRVHHHFGCCISLVLMDHTTG